MPENQKSGLKGLDIVGGAMILLAILWAIFFPVRHASLGSYSVAQLFPMILGLLGFACVVIARFRK